MLMTGNNSSEISLYFHIPFCTRKCDYCHFYVVPDRELSKTQLLQAFQQEWKQWLPSLKNKRIATIYFGGGTPSLFGPTRLAAILDQIQQDVEFATSKPEITLEANPENIHLSLMQGYAQAGINRVSIGVQTLDDTLLQMLGRTHQAQKAIEAIYTTAKAGIKNISIDLMYDLPNQTLAHWQQTLEAIRLLPITHLSLYNLTIEPHTVFFKKQDILHKLIPNEEVSLAMYEMAVNLLESYELKRYEISAFAKPGYHSHHNVGYWTARPFLGFGPSAFSYWEGKRFRNVAHLNRYCEKLKLEQSPIDFEEQLDPQAHVRELLAIHIRLRSGVHLPTFQSQHGKLEEETWSTMRKLEKMGWIQFENEYVSLTRQGILFYDSVATELI